VAGEREALVGQAARERVAVAAVGVDDQHLGRGLGMAFDEAGQVAVVVALVEHVAADDGVEAAVHPRVAALGPRGFRAAPVAVPVAHRRQAVEPGVLVQEVGRQRMAVGGGDVDATSVAHQAGQGQPAADFQDALTRAQVAGRHVGGQAQARGPGHAEQGPGSG